MIKEKTWFVYLIECLDGTYYTGVSNDIEKRMLAHKTGKGSKYVKNRGFARLLYTKPCLGRSDALKKEYMIKQLTRAEKINFFVSY